MTPYQQLPHPDRRHRRRARLGGPRGLPRADDPAPGPPFAYTVGRSGAHFGQPELVVFGLDPDTAQTILNDLAERVRGGQRLHAGQRIGDCCWPSTTRLTSERR
jgi:hypothetical protein